MTTPRKPSADIKASQYLPAQDFIHTYKLNQWRMTAYLEALDTLPRKGIMVTDTSISKFVGATRTPSSIRNLIKPLIKVGLVKMTGDTELGNSYSLTRLGEKAVVEAKTIVNTYYASLESGEPLPEPPNYQNSFERLNREIKTQRQTIESMEQTIGYQAQIIDGLKSELDALKASGIQNTYPIPREVFPQNKA